MILITIDKLIKDTPLLTNVIPKLIQVSTRQE